MVKMTIVSSEGVLSGTRPGDVGVGPPPIKPGRGKKAVRNHESCFRARKPSAELAAMGTVTNLREKGRGKREKVRKSAKRKDNEDTHHSLISNQ